MPQASRTRGEKQPPRSIVPKRVEVPRPRCKPGSEYSFAVHTIHVEPTALHRLHPQRRPLRRSWREVRSFRRQKLATDLFVMPFTYCEPRHCGVFHVSSLPTGPAYVHSRRLDQQTQIARACGSDSTTHLKLPAPCHVQIHHASSVPNRQMLFPASRDLNNLCGTFDPTSLARLCVRYSVVSATRPLLP